METVPLVSVVDARDAHDRVRSDVAPTAGAQKSLRFTVAGLRQVFRASTSGLRWTHTENMLADALTKVMDSAHLLATLSRNEWAIRYVPEMMKSSVRAAKRARELEEKKAALDEVEETLEKAARAAQDLGYNMKRVFGMRFALRS